MHCGYCLHRPAEHFALLHCPVTAVAERGGTSAIDHVLPKICSRERVIKMNFEPRRNELLQIWIVRLRAVFVVYTGGGGRG